MSNLTLSNYNVIKSTLMSQAHASNVDHVSAKDGFFNYSLGYMKARYNHSTVRNDLRKNIGKVIHGKAHNNHIGLSFYIGNKPQMEGQYKNINDSFQNYAKSVLSHKNNKKNSLQNESTNFLKSILDSIPEVNKNEAKEKLNTILNASTQLINCVQMEGCEIEEMLTEYFNACEALVELIFPNSKDNSDDVKKLKIAILCSLVFAGFYSTYLERTTTQKAAIIQKQNLAIIAYIIGAALGVGLTFGLGAYVSPVASSAIGVFTGYLLTKFIDKVSDILFEKTKHEINSEINLKSSIKYAKEMLGLNDKNYEFIQDEKINFREKAHEIRRSKQSNSTTFELKSCKKNIKNPSLYSPQIQNLKKSITSKNGLDKKELKQLLVNLYNENLEIQDNNPKDLQELYSLLHNLINCTDSLSAKMVLVTKKRVEAILCEIIPKNMDEEDKQALLCCIVLLPMNLRDLFSVISKRYSEEALFVVFDTLTDLTGIGITIALSSLQLGLSFAADFCLSFAASLVTGCIPVIGGIATFFALEMWLNYREKRGVQLPNDTIFEDVKVYKEERLKEIKKELENKEKQEYENITLKQEKEKLEEDLLLMTEKIEKNKQSTLRQEWIKNFSAKFFRAEDKRPLLSNDALPNGAAAA